MLRKVIMFFILLVNNCALIVNSQATVYVHLFPLLNLFTKKWLLKAINLI